MASRVSALGTEIQGQTRGVQQHGGSGRKEVGRLSPGGVRIPPSEDCKTLSRGIVQGPRTNTIPWSHIPQTFYGIRHLKYS